MLTNGNLVVANWSGHGRDDVKNTQKGPQIIEYSPDGKVLWTFYDPEKLDSIHHPVIMDRLDTALPYEEAGGQLVPMTVSSPLKVPVLPDPPLAPPAQARPGKTGVDAPKKDVDLPPGLRDGEGVTSP